MSQALEDNKRIVRQFPEEIATKGNYDLLDEIVAPDVVDHGVFGIEARGRDEVRAQMEWLREAFPDFEATVEEIIGEGDLVAMRVRLRGTQEGEFMGIPPSGEAFEVRNVVFSRIEDGKIAERWVQPDLLGMLHQLGAEKIPSEPPTP